MRSRPPWIFSTTTYSAAAERRGRVVHRLHPPASEQRVAHRRPARVVHRLRRALARLVEEVPLLKAEEVRARIEQPVGVVDAQAVHLPPGEELEGERVGLLEDVEVLDTDGGEAVDVEEAPVVDLLPCHPPVRQPVRDVALEEAIQRVEAARIARVAVQPLEVRPEVLGDHRRAVDQRSQPPLQHLLLAAPLEHLLRRGVPPRGQVPQPGEDALELHEVGMGLAELCSHLVDAGAEHVLVRPGVQREEVVEVAEGDAAALVLELQLAAVEHHAVLVPEDGEQDLVPQLRLHRVPLDVEEVGVDRGRPVLQHVLPERRCRRRSPCGWARCPAPA